MLWLLEDINAEDWYIEMSRNPENLADEILEKFTNIHERNPRETYERLIFQQEKLWGITERNMNFLLEFLSV